MDQLQQDLRRMRRQGIIQTSVIVFLILFVGLLFGLVKTNLPILSAIGPQGPAGQTVKGDTGDSTSIDYDKIYRVIDAKIAELPKAQDGHDGANGTNGRDAQPCTTTPTETGAQLVCPDGTTTTVINGVNGDSGAPGRTREQRCVQTSLFSARMDYRYEGDLNWQVDYYLPFGSFCP